MTYLALDIETTGLDPHRDKIISVGVYGPDCQEVFTDLDSFKKFDAERKPSYVFHNGSFDLHFLFRNGIDLYDRYWFDTKSVSSILYPRPTQLEGELSVFSLQNLCRLFLGVEPWKLDRENLNDKYSLEEIKAYNLKDCEMTWKLMGQLIAKIEVQSGSRGLEFISNWIMPASVLCAKMERNGIEIDKKGLDSYAETIENKKEELLKQLNQTAARGIQAYHESQIEGLKQVYDMMLAKALVKAKDPKKAKERYKELYEKALLKLEPFNWSSPTQLSWLLKNYYGLDLENKREQKETTNEAKLRELAEVSPVCKALVDFREVDKLCSSSIPALRDNLSPQGRVHARFNVGGTRTGRLSSSKPNCLSLDTEILTSRGFKTPNNLHPTDLIAQYSPLTSEIEFVVPESIYQSEYNQSEMISVKNQHLDILVTPNHRCLFRDRKSGKFSTTLAEESKWTDNEIIHAGYLKQNKSNYSNQQLAFVLATQADGSFTKPSRSQIDFGFSKIRKITRLEGLLKELGLEYKKHEGSKRTRFLVQKPEFLNTFLTEDKKFKLEAVSKLSLSELRFITEEQAFWDGLSTRPSREYCSKHEINADFIQLCGTLSGQRAHKSKYVLKDSVYYRVSFSDRDYSLTTNSIVTKKVYNNKVWCVKVPSSYIITRRGSDTFITGNCQQIPKGRIREFIVASPGKIFFIADYAQIEVRVLAHLSQEKRFIEAFREGIDPYSLIAASLLKLDCPIREIKERFKKERDVSKTAGLSILYGTGGAKLQEVLAKELGLSYSINKCKEFIDDYRNSFPDLKAFKEKLERSLINQRVSYNLLGRPFVIEDNEDLYMKAFNTLVQGSSSDLVVAGALEIDKVLTEAQIPFEFKMLVHDEIVIEIPEELGSQVADLLEDLMTKDMEQKLNLDVPLKIEYALDRCWRKP